MDAQARIAAGLLYTETDAAPLAPRRRAGLVHEYNLTSPDDDVRRATLLRAILGSVGERVHLASPFHAAYGSNTYIGDDFFGNAGLALLDDVEIRIGNGVMIAPHVTITTTGHPLHPALREDFRRFSEPVTLEDRVWIGANATVMPGVTIGYGAVVGAGAVVTHDVPAMTVAVGVPCRVVRAITDADLDERSAPA